MSVGGAVWRVLSLIRSVILASVVVALILWGISASAVLMWSTGTESKAGSRARSLEPSSLVAADSDWRYWDGGYNQRCRSGKKLRPQTRCSRQRDPGGE